MYASRRRKRGQAEETAPNESAGGVRPTASQRSPLSDRGNNAMDWTPMPAKRTPVGQRKRPKKQAFAGTAALASPEQIGARLKEQIAMFEDIDKYVRATFAGCESPKQPKMGTKRDPAQLCANPR